MKARNPLPGPRGYLLPPGAVSDAGRPLSAFLTPDGIGLRERRGKLTSWLPWLILWRLARQYGRTDFRPGGHALRVACEGCGAVVGTFYRRTDANAAALKSGFGIVRMPPDGSAPSTTVYRCRACIVASLESLRNQTAGLRPAPRVGTDEGAG